MKLIDIAATRRRIRNTHNPRSREVFWADLRQASDVKQAARHAPQYSAPKLRVVASQPPTDLGRHVHSWTLTPYHGYRQCAGCRAVLTEAA